MTVGAVTVRVDLDWSGPGHVDWSAELPCRVGPWHRTFERDDEGRACCRHCAAQEQEQVFLDLIGARLVGVAS